MTILDLTGPKKDGSRLFCLADRLQVAQMLPQVAPPYVDVLICDLLLVAQNPQFVLSVLGSKNQVLCFSRWNLVRYSGWGLFAKHGHLVNRKARPEVTQPVAGAFPATLRNRSN